MEKRYVVVVAVGVILLSGPRAALADEIAELKGQVEQIRQENHALREQLDRQQALTERLLTKVETLEHASRAAPGHVQGVAETPMESALERQPEPPAFINIPRLLVRGFADGIFNAKWTDSEQNNTFILGAVDFYTTSEVTDQVNVLVEATFNSDTDTNAATYRLERALVKYSYSDLLNVTVGRMHAPVSYWNMTYHHGNWLQTTIFRPDIVLHEAENGAFIPVHQVGIDLSGATEFEGVDVGYNVGLFNGRGRTVTEVQHVKDKNDSKAVNFHVSLKPHAIAGLTLGATAWLDEIPGNPPTAARREQINELVLGQYATYYHGNTELIGELFNILHDDKTSGEEFDTIGFYLQGGYRIGALTPYYRFDFIDVANGDPFYTAPRNLDRTRHTLGLRWDFQPWNALKLEYSALRVDMADDEQALNVNWSFAF